MKTEPIQIGTNDVNAGAKQSDSQRRAEGNGFAGENGRDLLDELEGVLRRYVILPPWAAETLGFWTLHTYAFELRDVTTYIGIESPEKRCGKTTLLGALSEL